MLSDKSILVTGGTGSFGRQFIAMVLQKYPEVRRIAVFSRDELKQYEMQLEYPPEKYRQLRYFIGDVRDRDRLIRAMSGVDTVIHAAALKQVPACEYNPFEAIKTNVLGAQNVVEAAIESGVQSVVALSTDKAAAPANLYGATKLASDKLFCAANHYSRRGKAKFAVVRYGNVLGSRGSVFPLFLKRRADGVLPITDGAMTRFNITLNEGVNFVLQALDEMWGGEIFVPKIPSYRISDVAAAVAPNCKQKIIGIRPGEKLHEEMITETDASSTLEFENHYVILPALPTWELTDYLKARPGTYCRQGFRYISNENDRWLSIEDLRRLIRTEIDPSFEPQ